MDKPVTVDLPLRAAAPNGERPGRDAKSKKLFRVDIREPALHTFDPATRDDVPRERPARIGCHALDGQGGARMAPATGLYHIRVDTGTPRDERVLACIDGFGRSRIFEAPAAGALPDPFSGDDR